MWTLETYKEIYTRYQASGLCARDFCSNEQITRSRFYYWQKKYLKLYKHATAAEPHHHGVKHPAGEPGFIPLLVSSGSDTQAPASKAIQRGSPLSKPATQESIIEICYPTGTTVRISGSQDIELIKTLIQLSR
ncbi:MAG: hypothetical protein LBV74_14135 [Tannerella sp.]|jgi:hypothetical protein|nr:hypothetical protein [Tannerella sp.]